jgi:hypothetical protein
MRFALFPFSAIECMAIVIGPLTDLNMLKAVKSIGVIKVHGIF